MDRRAFGVSWRRVRSAIVLVFLVLMPAAAQAPENGIHVGRPKVYDTRDLTLMLDELSQSLRKTNFIDPKALASALGNLQGYSNTDFSQGFMANGAVGPQAASVFSAATAAASPTAAGTTTTPTVSINVAPVLNSGATPTPPAPSPVATIGPQPPALPTLQTAPAFTPNFGSNAGDLLSDEVNLTYQFENLRMLLNRSLSDRLYDHTARLQAVVGFDVDIEPSAEMKDAAAVVDVKVTLADCDGVTPCATGNPISIVAMMPEEGSHNAATLSQRADGLGGAVASAVFSVGYSAQKRSQNFYLYRDMDTVSFQKPDPASASVEFGWQFRPVLGRHAVSPGTRHMIAVLALPASDPPGAGGKAPKLSVTVSTSWTHYEGATQTTRAKPGFWRNLFGGDDLPKTSSQETFSSVTVPTTATTQTDLGPIIHTVKWVQGDAAAGVAVVTGENFFSGTTVRFGAKTYSTPSEGMVIKSDQQLEVALPLSSAITEGVLSGRYGKALPLEAHDTTLPVGFEISALDFAQVSDDLYQVDATLSFYDTAREETQIQFSDLDAKVNRPIVSINGAPLSTPSFISPVNDHSIKVTTFAPISLAKGGSVNVGVTFPFAGRNWSASLPHGNASLKVDRIGGKVSTRLLISSTDTTMLLCGYHPAEPNRQPQTWVLQLDGVRSFTVLAPGAPIPPSGALKCADEHLRKLSLDVPTNDLKQYHRFALVNTEGVYPLMLGDIPKPEPPPPGPSLDKDQKVSVSQYDVKTVTYKGKNLDQVKKVLFDKAELRFTASDDGKKIVISLSPTVTSKPRSVELQLVSDDNDPVMAPLSVISAPAQNTEKKK
jgi:hypothetical protein